KYRRVLQDSKTTSLRVCRDQRNAGAGARRATGRDRSGYGQSRWRHAARGGRQDGGSRPQCAQPPLFGFARHPSAARGNHPAVPDELRRGTRSRDGSDCHHRRQGRPGAFALCGGRTGRCGGLAESGIIMPEGHACLLPMPSPAEFLNRLEDLYRTSTRQPKLILISFPHNPTTTCVDLDFFREIVGMASRYGTLVVHDFAYADLGFDGYKPPSILQVDGAKEVAVEIFSMSKSYNMAGWRVGYCLGNPRMIGALARIKSYLDYGVFQPIQIASIIALRECEEDTRKICAIYQKRRDVLVSGLQRAGWPVEKPRGSMFVWAPLPERYRADGSLEFAKLLMEKALVAVSPGIGFGPLGEGYVRFALVENEHRIRQATRSIGKFLKS